MDGFRVAAKAFIIRNGKVLLLKRRPNDAHRPNWWDIPGGRLEPGEDPRQGVQRETMEETGLSIDVLAPIDVHNFTRDDGQKITMIVFLCRPTSESVTLSEEHTEYKWAEPKKGSVPEWLDKTVENFNAYMDGGFKRLLS